MTGGGALRLDTKTVRIEFASMKNITFSAEEELLRKAHGIAHQHSTSLNGLFRTWLKELTLQPGVAKSDDRLMNRLATRASGRRFNRDEMNER